MRDYSLESFRLDVEWLKGYDIAEDEAKDFVTYLLEATKPEGI